MLLNKPQKQQLKIIAKTLPPTYELKPIYKATRFTSASEGHVYVGKASDFVRVDHFKQLCRIFKDSKPNEVRDRLRQYVADVNSIKMSAQIGNFPIDLEIIGEGSKYFCEGEDNDDDE